MIPGPAMICPGTVFHRRNRPRVHAFSYPVSYLWLDPDRPEDVCGSHWAWSSTSPVAPVRFRTADYGLDPQRESIDPDQIDVVRLPLARQARTILHRSTGLGLDGPVRMITQPRRFGWLFNPITVYLLWPAGDTSHGPDGAVLEVTNTPWKERHHYAVALAAGRPGPPASWTARFDKELHVSPFLDENAHYELRLTSWPPANSDGPPSRLDIDLDVVDAAGTVVETRLSLEPQPVTAATLGRSLRRHGLPTHRTSFGIHHQALRLAAKRVPFVPHPRSRT